ncbi:MAG: DUF1552 domain-containing protein [Alphaproteobacteria bacterium]|nr:DUF1552 domain-containing protein [Alphaproteobacteria bacterium]
MLKGLGGVVLPLPLLTSLPARGAERGDPHPLVIVRQGNGVAQGNADEGDSFWPTQSPGPITTEGLRQQASQSTAVLARFAPDLLMVRGTSATFPALAERHAAGGNQLLTAMPPGAPTHTIMTYARGESVDNLVARLQPQVNGGEPLTLFTGGRAGMGEEVLSYRGPDDLRAAEDDPWSVYKRLTGGAGSPDQRRSVNDFVLDQLRELSASSQLSAEDRLRLERHTDSVRDFEVLCGKLASQYETTMEGLSGLGTLDENRITMARLHCEILALALECDLVRAATLQVGDRTDLTQYTIDGVKLRQFHSISHREQGPADYDLHRSIDRMMLTDVYGYLLNRLEERGILQRSVVVWVSELGDGVTHDFNDLPWMIAGRGDGTLINGGYVRAANKSHNKLLNTLITATGIRAADGGPWTTFGDPSLEPGLLDTAVSPSAPI